MFDGSPQVNKATQPSPNKSDIVTGIMKFALSLSSIFTAALISPAAALPPPRPHNKPVYLVLAGDSTTATDGGWGDGFLANALREPAGGKNLGHSGATTVSFRERGDWAAVLDDVKSHKDSHKVFVTIQVSLKERTKALIEIQP